MPETAIVTKAAFLFGIHVDDGISGFLIPGSQFRNIVELLLHTQGTCFRVCFFLGFTAFNAMLFKQLFNHRNTNTNIKWRRLHRLGILGISAC